jgi:hypothetical protein
MSKHNYLLEMEETRTCIACDVLHTECRMIGVFCLGGLTMRPAVCPLVSVRKPNHEDIKSYKQTWVEG